MHAGDIGWALKLYIFFCHSKRLIFDSPGAMVVEDGGVDVGVGGGVVGGVESYKKMGKT